MQLSCNCAKRANFDARGRRLLWTQCLCNSIKSTDGRESRDAADRSFLLHRICVNIRVPRTKLDVHISSPRDDAIGRNIVVTSACLIVTWTISDTQCAVPTSDVNETFWKPIWAYLNRNSVDIIGSSYFDHMKFLCQSVNQEIRNILATRRCLLLRWFSVSCWIVNKVIEFRQSAMHTGMARSFRYWSNVWLAGKAVWSSLTRAIHESFRDEFLVIKRYTNLRLLHFTLHNI